MAETVQGFAKTLRAIGKARVAKPIALDKGLEKAAQVILRASQKYVPVATGELKASGQVVGNGGSGMGVRYSVVYAAPYAVYVHEDLSKYHAPPTQAKYLERAVREVRGTVASIVRREVEIS